MKILSARKPVALATLVCFTVAVGPLGARAARAADTAKESPLQIISDPLSCVTPDYAPTVDASVRPEQLHEKSYVFFRAESTEDYYYVVMSGQPATLEGVLPRPLPVIKGIEYYLQSTDTNSLKATKPKVVAPVVEDKICEKKTGAPVGPEGAGLTVGLTSETQNPVPPGFNQKDVSKVILVSGSVVTLAAALKAFTGGAAGTGGTTAAGTAAVSTGGIGAGTIAIVGGVAAVGAGVAIASSSGGSSSNEQAPAPLSVSATASPTSGAAPLTVQFAASATGGRTPYSFSWAFGDGSAPSTLQNPTNTYRNPGSYVATVTAADSANQRASASVAVTASGPPPLRFLEADASWSGAGDIDVTLLSPSNASVGTRVPAGCESTVNRTERVLLQASPIPSGTYTVTLKAATCGSATPASIAAIVTVVTDSGPATACAGKPVSVPVGQTVTACQVTVP